MKTHRNSLRTGPPVHCCSLCKAATPWRPAWKGPNQHLPCLRFQILPQIVSNQKFFRSQRLTETLPKSALFVVVAASPRMSKSKQGNIESHLYQESKPITAPIPVYILIPCCPSPPHFTSPRFLPGFFHPSLLALCLEQQKGMAVSRALEPKSQGPCAP